MSNTKTETRTRLGFSSNRSNYCCGMIEIGDFLLAEKNRWDRNAKEPQQFTPEEGLKQFQERLREEAMGCFCEGAGDYSEGEYPRERTALVQATVVPNEFLKTYNQNIAKEYLEADGFELVTKFDNVNSRNTVYLYQKVCPVGQWLYDEYGGEDD